MSINEDFIKKMILKILPQISDEFICIVKENNESQQEFDIKLIFINGINDESKIEIERYIRCIPNVKNIEISCINKKILTEINILRIIKILQPVTIEQIITKINNDDFYYEDDEDHKFIRHMLDKLRKNNYIIRSSEAKHFVTEKSLDFVPHGTFKNSSDIARVLAINSRKC